MANNYYQEDYSNRGRRSGSGGGAGFGRDYYDSDNNDRRNRNQHQPQPHGQHRDRNSNQRESFDNRNRGYGRNSNPNSSYDGGGGGNYGRGSDTSFQEDWPIRGGGSGGSGNWLGDNGGQGSRDFDGNGGHGSRNQRQHRGERERDRDRNSDRRDRRRDHEEGARGSDRRSINHERVEQQRVEVSRRNPRATFLEEVDLPIEYAFRVDTRSERVNLPEARSFRFNQTPSYQRSFYADNMFGASEEYISKLPPNRRCKPKSGIDEFGNVVDPETEQPIELEDGSTATLFVLETAPKPIQRSVTVAKPIQFLSLESAKKPLALSKSGRIDFSNSLNLSKKAGNGIQEKAEQYNIKVRQEPKNISLWREFVQFQDQVFDETNQVFEDEGEEAGVSGKGRKNKSKGKKKALIEKKIAILDKALVANPKCIELCVDRLDLVYEIYKPTYVLTEWKKLVSVNQELATFWFEYFRFASTQLQLFTSREIIQVFGKSVDKFRSMLTSTYQPFQRPVKCSLVLADILFSIALILRNAGFTEKSVAIHQAQLEIDFHTPNTDKSNGSEDWKSTLKSFEEFWPNSSLRFGEPGANGWNRQKEITTQKSCEPSFIPDSQVSSFEEEFFSSVTDFELESSQQKPDSVVWLYIESLRSKLYWTPWRAIPNVNEEDTCDDPQRIVQTEDISPFLSNISLETYSSDFERQSLYFRHVINFLITLREDFLPATHTLGILLSPFTNFTLSDSRTLFSEIYFWKKFLNFYHEDSTPNTGQPNADGEKDATNSEIPVPEAFRLNEFIVPSQAVELESTMTLIPKYSDSIEEAKENLLRQGEINHSGFVRSVVEQSLDHLDPKFAAVLAQTLIRFEQRNTYSSKENHKSRMKYFRNLMKHEKLRSSAGTYGELAMLEYFGGSQQKAIDLLVKTINSSGKVLRESDLDTNLETDYDLIAEVSRLYKMLAEFYLRDSPETALRVLIALGNKFAAVDLALLGTDVKPSTNSLLRAKRFFGFVMKSVVPAFEDVTKVDGAMAEDADDSNDEPDASTAENINFEEKLKSDQCIEFMLQDANLVVEWTSVFALFRYLSGDFESASELFVDIMAKTKPEESLDRSSRYKSSAIFRNNIREQLYANWSKLSALVLSKTPTHNSKFRSILCNALQEFPSSPALLVLFTDVESQCSIVGKLWRAMVSIIKQDSSQTQNTTSLHWAPLFMTFGLAQQIEKLELDETIGLDSFGLGGPAVPPDTIFYKLDAVLTAAEANPLTRNVPLIWRVHLKHLVMRANLGKDVARARALFYEAIRHCPSSKAIYLDGIAYFPEMTSEITDLMIQKEIMIRLPREELDLLMEIDNELEHEVMEAEKRKIKNDNENKSVQGEESIPASSQSKTKKRKKPDPELEDENCTIDLTSSNCSSPIKSKKRKEMNVHVEQVKHKNDERSALKEEVVVLSDGEIEENEIVDVSE